MAARDRYYCIILLDSNSNAVVMAYADVKLFHSYIGAALPVRGMALLSVISDMELSCVSWVLYVFFV